MMRRTNFNLGNDKNTLASTSTAIFAGPPNGYVAPSIDAQTKAELRSSHFAMGGHRSIYVTTNTHSFKDNSGASPGPDKRAQNERKAKMRGHNFSIGTDARSTNYVSQNASSLRDFSKEAVAQKAQADGTNIRSSHFRFGGESAPMISVQKQDYPQKTTSPVPGKVQSDFQKTNFQLGGYFPASISTAHLDFPNHKDHKVQRMNDVQRKSLRQTHFILGRHPYNTGACNAAYGAQQLRTLSVPRATNPQLLQSHFQLGDPNQANTYFNTQSQADLPERRMSDAMP